MNPSQLEILTKLDNGIFNTTLDVDRFCYIYAASLIFHYGMYLLAHHVLTKSIKS